MTIMMILMINDTPDDDYDDIMMMMTNDTLVMGIGYNAKYADRGMHNWHCVQI